MAGLKDQLLKTGLVSEKQIKKAEKEKRKEGQKQASGMPGGDHLSRHANDSLLEKQQRDRQLNQQQKEQAERKAVLAQVRQLIDTQKLPMPQGDIPFNFLHEGKVKKLYVDAKTRDLLIRGIIGLTHFDGRYDLVPRETVEKIRAREEAVIVLLNTGKSEADASDDPYAAFQVPEDLVW